MMLIGKFIVVTRARNPQLEGKSGRVVDETKNTIMLHNGITILKEDIEEYTCQQHEEENSSARS